METYNGNAKKDSQGKISEFFFYVPSEQHFACEIHLRMNVVRVTFSKLGHFFSKAEANSVLQLVVRLPNALTEYLQRMSSLDCLG